MKAKQEPAPAKVQAKVASKDPPNKPASKAVKSPKATSQKVTRQMSKAAATLGSLGGLAKEKNKRAALLPSFHITRNY